MLLTIKNLQVQYSSQIVLQIDKPIVINEGERIGIIGSNGAGKTTLVKSVLGLTNYKGSIHTNLKPEQIATHMQSNHASFRRTKTTPYYYYGDDARRTAYLL